VTTQSLTYLVLPMKTNQLNLFGWEKPTEADVHSKRCTKCRDIKPLSAFGKVNGGLIRPECKKCMNEMVAVRNRLRRENPAPKEDYVCPICKQSAEQVKDYGGKKNTPWVIDHCHETNKFRGWLCHRCNRALGGFCDDITFLNRAIEYLTA